MFSEEQSNRDEGTEDAETAKCVADWWTEGVIARAEVGDEGWEEAFAG